MRWALLFTLLLLFVSGCGSERPAPAKHPSGKALRFGALPREGVAVETARLGRPLLTFVGLDGRIYGRLKMALDSDSQLLRGVVLIRNPRTGKRYALDAQHLRLQPYTGRRRYPLLVTQQTGPRGCGTFARRGRERFLLCPASRRKAPDATAIDVLSLSGRHTIAGIPPHGSPPPDHPGFWAKAYLSPDGKTVLALWSRECESPTAFFAPRAGSLRPVTGERDWRKAPESVPLGWSRRGEAVVQLFEPGCGYGYENPGVYLIDPKTGAHRLVYQTVRSFAVMWGD